MITFHLFSSEGSNLTPAHHYPDFRLKTYAPLAFRYFRELFGIKPDDYLVSAWTLTHSHIHTTTLSAQCFLSVTQQNWKYHIILNFSTPSAMSLWSSCPTPVPAARGSTSQATTSSSSRPCSTKRQSSCRSCCLVTTWWAQHMFTVSLFVITTVSLCRVWQMYWSICLWSPFPQPLLTELCVTIINCPKNLLLFSFGVSWVSILINFHWKTLCVYPSDMW